MRTFPIQELLDTLTKLAAQYPEAQIDFVYPRIRAGKRYSILSNVTGYEVILDQSYADKAIVRFCIDYAATERRGETAEEGG